MEVFYKFITDIINPEHQKRMAEVLTWIHTSYPQLGMKIAWNQPMFTDHETFILGLSVSKSHIAVAAERITIQHFSDDIKTAGYDHTAELIRFPWHKAIDFGLLKQIIDFNILDKANVSTFWRK